MRELEYKPKSFRLNEKTYNTIKEIAKKDKLSYNLLFIEMINLYKKNN